jgi:Icc protein
MRFNTFRGLVLGAFLPVMLAFGACEKFEYSPNEVKLEESEQDLNQKNIDKIMSMRLDQKSTFRIAVISDTQRFYDELDEVVDAINSRNDFDFVVLNGDITDFGIAKEYRWINERMQKLKVPFITVLGNHDCQGNGKKIYKAMYGPYDFTVNIGLNRLFFINTNSLEFNDPVPDLNFFRGALSDTANFDKALVFAHIAPFDPDFNRDLEPEFTRISSQGKVQVSLHGHQHGYQEPKQPYHDGVNYVIVGSIQKRFYEEVTVSKDQVKLNHITF